jgi:hypothetical protein
MALRTQFPLSAFEIRDELGIASSESISILSDAVRRLAAQNPPRNDVRFSELLGKSNRTPLFDVLVVAGGGGGAGRDGFSGGGGGGGGVIYTSDYSVSAGTSYSITVGSGGSPTGPGVNSTSGQNSSFVSIVAIGGGYGAFGNESGGDGGSGGATDRGGMSVGLGTAGQGNNGALGSGYAGGGGGGASSAGSSPPDDGLGGLSGGNGGNGFSSSISGTTLIYGGGGGGGGLGGNLGGGGGGSGGSGAGGNTVPAGTPFPNQGGGGGGANGVVSDNLGSSGAAGVVIISYPQQYSNAASVSGSFTLTIANGRKIYKWTSGSGSITF